ncbi:MAG: hypothetical protein K6F32_03705 [Bacilli bacterium]|nr:hypothetical protein [Bacilli bacterium]
MRKLQIKDLTPEMLKEVSALETKEDVVAYFAAKDLEISLGGAEKLLEESKKEDLELDEETLANVAGGGCFGSNS